MQASNMISLDCETTGLDLHHSAQPFLVTLCNEQGENTWWEWDVDPLTRLPEVPDNDLREIQNLIDGADLLVLQNSKFDYQALKSLFQYYNRNLRWDWNKVHDTLYAGHLLASNHPHDLTSMAVEYLGINIAKYEDRMKKVVTEARSYISLKKNMARFEGWKKAKKGLEGMPSATDSMWKYDTWLPRAIALHENRLQSDPYWTVTAEYANADSATTLELFKAQRRILKSFGLYRIYQERLKLLPIVSKMEETGITVSGERLEKLTREFSEERDLAERKCINLAGTNEEGEPILDKLPKSGTSNALKRVLFERLELPVLAYSAKTGEPSVDKNVLDSWLATLPERSKQHTFVRNLRDYRKRATAIAYMEGYQRFWLPLGQKDWWVLHPSLNPTGTDTIRWSSSSPNEQNVSKTEGFNLRYAFGPAPGREWWSLDAKNIELRIPAYESGETELIELFKHPDDPPYYGSTHLLNFSTIYPDLWKKAVKEVGLDKAGPHCKKKYASTWYQWCKNGGFAVQYGAVDRTDGAGTADRAFHKPGAHALLKSRFGKLEQLNRKYIRFANEHGYVETLPDRTVDPERGYPLLCTRSNYGDIKPTVPFNYHVQSTAMWVMMRMMIEVCKYLEQFEGYHLVMQVHDEIVLDFPYRKNQGNLKRVLRVKKVMDSIGNDLIPAMPLPVGIEYHPETWADGEVIV